MKKIYFCLSVYFISIQAIAESAPSKGGIHARVKQVGEALAQSQAAIPFTASTEDMAKFAKIVALMDDDEFEARESGSAEAMKLPLPAFIALYDQLIESGSPECKQRIFHVRKDRSGEIWQALRAGEIEMDPPPVSRAGDWKASFVERLDMNKTKLLKASAARSAKMAQYHKEKFEHFSNHPEFVERLKLYNIPFEFASTELNSGQMSELRMWAGHEAKGLLPNSTQAVPIATIRKINRIGKIEAIAAEWNRWQSSLKAEE